MTPILRRLMLALFLVLLTALSGVQVRAQSLLVESAPHDSLLAVEIAAHMQPLIDNFQIRVGMYTDFPLRIVVAANHEDYQNLVRDAGGVLEFSEAHYNRAQQTVYLRHPSDMKQVERLGVTMLHEYIHAYVDHYWRDAPLWFHEGMAVYFTEGVGLERSAQYALAALFGHALTLPEMNEYPAGAASWEMFYTKSALAVQYLYTRRQERFFDLWEEAPRSDGRFDNALAVATGQTVESFSDELERHLRAQVRWESLLAGSTLAWSLVPLLMLIGWARSQLRNRRTERTWGDTDIDESDE